jgi:hypothetical protein
VPPLKSWSPGSCFNSHAVMLNLVRDLQLYFVFWRNLQWILWINCTWWQIISNDMWFLNLQHGWLRHYATSRKVAGSIPEEVTGFFNLPRLMILQCCVSFMHFKFCISWLNFTKFDMNIMPMEDTSSYFLISFDLMANVQTCEVGVTLLPLI